MNFKFWKRNDKSHGTFTLSAGGKTSKDIPYDASIRTLRRKIRGMKLEIDRTKPEDKS